MAEASSYVERGQKTVQGVTGVVSGLWEVAGEGRPQEGPGGGVASAAAVENEPGQETGMCTRGA